MAVEDAKKCGGVLEHLSKLPTVGFVVGKAKSFVSRARNSNGLFRIAVNTTENTLNYATPIISAVVMRFDRPVKLADDVACQALVKLEEKFPIITKSPDEITQMAKDAYDQTVITPVTTRANRAKNYGLTKITDAYNYANNKWIEFTKTTYGEVFVNKLSTAVTSVDKYVEDNLVKSQEKKDWTITPEDELPTKLQKLSSKLYRLLTHEIRQKQEVILNFMERFRMNLQSRRQHTTNFLFTASSQFLATIPGFNKIFPSLVKSSKEEQETPRPPKEKKSKES